MPTRWVAASTAGQLTSAAAVPCSPTFTSLARNRQFLLSFEDLSLYLNTTLIVKTFFFVSEQCVCAQVNDGWRCPCGWMSPVATQSLVKNKLITG